MGLRPFADEGQMHAAPGACARAGAWYRTGPPRLDWRRVTLLTRRTNCLVSSVSASARISAGERFSDTARSFLLGSTLLPPGEREQTPRCPLRTAYTLSH